MSYARVGITTRFSISNAIFVLHQSYKQIFHPRISDWLKITINLIFSIYLASVCFGFFSPVVLIDNEDYSVSDFILFRLILTKIEIHNFIICGEIPDMVFERKMASTWGGSKYFSNSTELTLLLYFGNYGRAELWIICVECLNKWERRSRKDTFFGSWLLFVVLWKYSSSTTVGGIAWP